MMKILVVDDSEDFRILCKYELEDAGYEVILAATGARAMESFRKEKPDLVVLDIKLPDMDGLELLGRMKEISGDVPVIMHTAFDYMYDLACDASDAYVVKSADFRELKDTIRQVTKDRAPGKTMRPHHADTEGEFTSVVIKMRESHLRRLRELGAHDEASLAGMIDEALCAYIRNRKP